MEHIFDQALVVLFLGILPILGISVVLGLVAAIFQSLTLINAQGLFLSVQILLLAVAAYLLFPSLVEPMIELFRLSFAGGVSP